MANIPLNPIHSHGINTSFAVICFQIPTPNVMIIPILNRLITARISLAAIITTETCNLLEYTFFARFYSKFKKEKGKFTEQWTKSKLLQCTTIHWMRFSITEHWRGEQWNFKRIKLALTNAFAKVYTRRLKDFTVHAVFHDKHVYGHVSSLIVKWRSEPSVELWLNISGVTRG